MPRKIPALLKFVATGKILIMLSLVEAEWLFELSHDRGFNFDKTIIVTINVPGAYNRFKITKVVHSLIRISLCVPDSIISLKHHKL